MNAPSKISESGQVTLPQDVLDQLGVGPGASVEFRRTENGDVILEKAGTRNVADRIDALVGHAGAGLTTDEIMLMTRGNLDDDTY